MHAISGVLEGFVCQPISQINQLWIHLQKKTEKLGLIAKAVNAFRCWGVYHADIGVSATGP